MFSYITRHGSEFQIDSYNSNTIQQASLTIIPCLIYIFFFKKRKETKYE